MSIRVKRQSKSQCHEGRDEMKVKEFTFPYDFKSSSLRGHPQYDNTGAPLCSTVTKIFSDELWQKLVTNCTWKIITRYFCSPQAVM